MRFIFKKDGPFAGCGGLSLESKNFEPDAGGVFEIPGALVPALMARFRNDITASSLRAPEIAAESTREPLARTTLGLPNKRGEAPESGARVAPERSGQSRA